MESINENQRIREYQGMKIKDLQSMKNEIMIEVKNENRKIVEKLMKIVEITQSSIDSQNAIIINLSGELRAVKKDSLLRGHLTDSILETVQSLSRYNQMIDFNKTNLIDNSNSNDSYSNTSINDENILENNNIILKTEINDEIEDISTFNENNDNDYYNNNLINMTDTMIDGENILNDLTNSPISNEIIIKTEFEDCIVIEEENISENLGKVSNLNKENSKKPLPISGFRKILPKEGKILGAPPKILAVPQKIVDKYISALPTILPAPLKILPVHQLNDESSIENLHAQSLHFNKDTHIDDENRYYKDDERPYKCDICDKRFTQYCNLNKHLRVHTGERPFECTYCSKRFTQSSSLNLHIKLHTGENLFHCDICSRTFTQSSRLVQHRRAHTGLKPFDCSQCHKTFTSACNLKEHRKIHKIQINQNTPEIPFKIPSEWPFKCDICNKRFNQSSSLSRHLRTHTEEERDGNRKWKWHNKTQMEMAQ